MRSSSGGWVANKWLSRPAPKSMWPTSSLSAFSHEAPLNPDRPELDNAQKILADQAARRDALFQQSFENEKNKGDALSKRFEEALKEAKKEPVSRPLRGFDLD